MHTRKDAESAGMVRRGGRIAPVEEQPGEVAPTLDESAREPGTPAREPGTPGLAQPGAEAQQVGATPTEEVELGVPTVRALPYGNQAATLGPGSSVKQLKDRLRQLQGLTYGTKAEL